MAVIFTYISLVGVLVFYALHYTNVHPSANPKYWLISTLLGLFILSTFIYLMYGIYTGLFMEEFTPSISDPTFVDRLILKIAIVSTFLFHGIPVAFNPNYIGELL